MPWELQEGLSLSAVVVGMVVWVLGDSSRCSTWASELTTWVREGYLGSLGCSGMMVFALRHYSASKKVGFLLQEAV